MTAMSFIVPDWPAPSHIKALTTTRHLSSLDELNLPAQPLKLRQVHGSRVITADQHQPFISADGLYTQQPNQIAVIQTADCLPILLCDRQGTQVAALHAGWRGLADKIIQRGCHHFTNTNDVIAWIGPSISQACFEVGPDVYQAFTKIDSQLSQAFKPSAKPDTWLADLKWIARYQLLQIDVPTIVTSPYCTYSQPDLFYSYRRQKGSNGRLLSLIGMSANAAR